MALTLSTMTSIGSPLPSFSLKDTEGNTISSDDFSSEKLILIMFICNHCPYVKHIRPELTRIGADFHKNGIGVIAINSNDWGTHPEDSPEMMIVEKQEHNYNFPYLIDETQSVATEFQAACTPDFFLYDQDRKLCYRGRLDDSSPGNNTPLTGVELRQAIELSLKDQQVPVNMQKPSIGCNIKWRPGKEPAYNK